MRLAKRGFKVYAACLTDKAITELGKEVRAQSSTTRLQPAPTTTT